MKKKNKSSLIIHSLLTILGCVALSAGSTYSLFTSEATNNIVISSGKVDVSAEVSEFTTYSMDNAVTENKTDTIGYFANGGNATLTNGSLTLTNITPGDKVSYKVKVTNNSNLACSYRTSLLYSDDTGLFSGLKVKVSKGENDESPKTTIYVGESESLAVSSDPITYTVEVELPSDATSEYMNKSCTLNFKVEAVQGNGRLVDTTKIYTSLNEFNSAELDNNVKDVYLILDDTQEIKDSDLIIGSDALLDTRVKFNKNGTEYNVGDTFNLGDTTYTVTEHTAGSTDYKASTNHTVKNVYVVGNFKFNSTGAGNNKINDEESFKQIKFKLPDYSNVYFSSSTFSNYMRFGIGGDQPSAPTSFDSSTYLNLTTDGVPYSSLNTVSFAGSTFNGIWHQNGGKIYASNLNFDHVTFKNYINTEKANDSNPLWINTPQTTSISLTNSSINSSRPIKFIVGDASGTYNISNNTFNMIQTDSDKLGSDKKDVGIYIDGTSNSDKTLNGNINIKDNVVNKGTALIALANTLTMGSNKTFTCSGNKDSKGNELSKESDIKLAVTWKSSTAVDLPTSN